MATITTRAGKGSPLTNTEVDANFTNLNNDKIENVVEDTTPQLGGNLDLNSNDITGTGNINVTGTVTADGLTVDTSTDVEINCSNSFDGINITGSNVNGAGGRLQLLAPGASGTGRTLAILNDSRSSVDEIKFQANTDFAFSDFDTGDNRLRIADNGDISFYEGTGTTPKLFWDASAESLGIGTTSPAFDLDVSRTATSIPDDPTLQVKNLWAGEGNNVGFGNKATGLFSSGNGAVVTRIQSRYDSGANIGSVGTSTNHDFLLLTNDTERMRILAGGNVGIGTTSPNSLLHLASASPLITFTDTDNSAYAHVSMGSFGGLAFNADVGNTRPSTDIRFSVDNTERMRIDSSGNVGIGTSSPANPLHITKEIAGYQAYFDNANGSAQGVKVRIRANDPGNFNILELVSASTLSDVTAMVVRDDGNVGIGTSSPSVTLQVQNDSSTAYNPSTAAFNTVLSITNNTSGASNNALMSFTTESNGEWYIGGVQNSGNTAADFVFASRASGARAERMRIDSSGNLLVGTTATSTEAEGFRYRADLSAIASVADGGIAGYFGRLSSDGEILRFRKDATTVGSIGSRLGRAFIYSPYNTGSGLRFGDARVQPINSNGADSDNFVDLGSSGARFKNLYLSGGVYLGGTVAANYLDDYEESTVNTVSLTPASGTIGLKGAQNTIAYTKVGRMVTVVGYISVGSISSPSGALTLDLPFASADLDEFSGRQSGHITVNGANAANANEFEIIIDEGSSTATIVLSDGRFWSDAAAEMIVNTALRFSFSYFTT